jgi:hypothetical protein
MPEAESLTGGLVGWHRIDTQNGCILVLQLAQRREEFYNGNAQQISFALNDRQLRSLTRDLHRAADKRNLKLWAKPSIWKRMLGLRYNPSLRIILGLAAKRPKK